jgi:hypothetical protein
MSLAIMPWRVELPARPSRLLGIKRLVPIYVLAGSHRNFTVQDNCLLVKQYKSNLHFYNFPPKTQRLNMVVVAVAGGTGGIGSAIVDTLRPNPHHKMIILTRKVRDPSITTNEARKKDNDLTTSRSQISLEVPIPLSLSITVMSTQWQRSLTTTRSTPSSQPSASLIRLPLRQRATLLRRQPKLAPPSASSLAPGASHMPTRMLSPPWVPLQSY